MSRYRYIIGFLAVVGLAILIIVLLTSGSPKSKAPHKTPLVDYANTSAVVEMVVDGPIVAPADHNTLVVDVSQSSANADLIQGYNGNVINSLASGNSENSFKNFLYALFFAGYSDSTPSTFPSDTGLCAGGDRYDFYLKENGQTLQHFWTTNCSGLPKTYAGGLGLTINLFNEQIPNISNLTSNANF